MRDLYSEIDMALQFIKDGKVEFGLSMLHNLMEQGSENPEVLFELANVFYDLGHIDTARTLLEKTEPYLDELSTEELIEWRTMRAELWIDEGELDQAMEELLACLSLEPNFTRASILMADIYLMQNLPEVACRYLEGILEENSDEPDVRYILAELYIDLSEPVKAQYHLDFLQGTDYEEKAKVSRAKLLSKSGLFEQSLTLYQEVLSSNPNPEAMLGFSLTSMQLGKFEQAVYYGSRLLELEPDHIGAYQVVSTALQRMGRADKSKQLLEQALRLNDQEEAILLKLIEVCYELGEKNEAERYLDHFINHHEETEETEKWKQRLSLQ